MTKIYNIERFLITFIETQIRNDESILSKV